MTKKLIGLLIAISLLSGCATNEYRNFYTGYVDPKTHPHLEALSSGEEPQVYTSDDLDRDILTLRAKGYGVVGASGFNAEYQDQADAVAQAKDIGASLVLLSWEYTDTETSTTTLFLPDTQTTYFSGTVSGSATTYGTSAMPITTNKRRYDQTAVYLAKFKKKPRFGIQGEDLDSKMRRELGRNTGMLIEVVVEETPAFYANVLAGDVLIQVDDTPIRNYKDAEKVLGSVPESTERVLFTVLRDGEKETVPIELK